MSEEIKVGEYIRTETGEIGKLQKITIEPEVDIGIEIMPEITAYWLNQHTYVEKKDIVKHSKDIIDLIQVSDYVNGFKVLEIRRNENRILIGVYKDTETVIYRTLTNENVKSIVTHQQFREMEYKV